MASAGTQPRASAARALIERVMRDGQSAAAESPLIFGGAHGRPSGRLVSLAQGERVLSACAILVRDAQLASGARLRLGLIGWVATDPAARRRGLASQVLTAAEAELAAAGCELALLWADDPEFYRRRGYLDLGTERDLALDASSLRRLPAWEGPGRATRALDPQADAGATLGLYRGQPAHVRRTLTEHAALLGANRMRGRVATQDGAAVAYALEGRGGDLQGVVHEWSGDPEAVLGLQRELAGAALERGERAFVIGPGHEHPVCAAWEALDLAPTLGTLGMGRGLGASDRPSPSALHPPRAAEVSRRGLFLWGLDS
ncbi:MAG: GNAT family N-acetyltransferase, partial [Planctomycetota bacterium]